MIYYVILAFIDIGMFLSDNWKELTFTAAASGIGVILGKRIGVKFAVNYIMKYMGLQQPTQIEQQVAWLIKQEEMRGNPWNSQLNGQRTIRILSYKRFFLFLHRVTKLKRGVFKMNLSGKKKILAVGVAILINGCNDVFKLNLSQETITTVSALGGGYVLVEAIIDIVRAWSNKQKEVVVIDAIPTIDTSSNK